jgi:hypothetical protein
MSAAGLANLDFTAASAADEIQKAIGASCKGKRHNKVLAKDVENLATKALGVVQESGPFACGLFLLSKTGDKSIDEIPYEAVVACHIMSRLLSLPARHSSLDAQPAWQGGMIEPAQVHSARSQIIPHLVKIAGVSLEQLLLIKQIWERTLTYARYMARSRKET